MNVEMRDPAVLRALRPLEVAAYLRAKGWAQLPRIPGAAVWSNVLDDEPLEIVVPMDPSLRDFAARMGEVLHTLAVAESRSQSQVHQDLSTTFADVVRIRIDDPSLVDGTMSIDANAQVAQKVRDLVLAAACSATERRTVWHARKPTRAIDHVKNLRVGQTERGSYIVTVISRVPPAFHAPNNGQLVEGETPFERRVTQGLANSLKRLDEAAASAALSGELASFEESIATGVSANLCEAVVGLWGEDDGQRSVDFQFSWSPARPEGPETPSKTRFSADRIPLIREAARVMRERAPVDDFELEGAVVKLDRVPGQPMGKITVIGHVDDKPRHVALELGDVDYQIAIRTHQQNKILRCVGSLVREGRGYALRDPRDVSVGDA